MTVRNLSRHLNIKLVHEYLSMKVIGNYCSPPAVIIYSVKKYSLSQMFSNHFETLGHVVHLQQINITAKDWLIISTGHSRGMTKMSTKMLQLY